MLTIWGGHSYLLTTFAYGHIKKVTWKICHNESSDHCSNAEARELIDMWQKGTKLRVSYNPSNPKKHSIHEASTCGACALVRGAFGASLCVYGLYLIFVWFLIVLCRRISRSTNTRDISAPVEHIMHTREGDIWCLPMCPWDRRHVCDCHLAYPNILQSALEHSIPEGKYCQA